MTTQGKIKPALTPAEWAPITEVGGTPIPPPHLALDWGTAVDWFIERRHAAAALALYRAPFGFAWEDVDRIYEMAGAFFGTIEEPTVRVALLSPWNDLADRIAALLPPRESPLTREAGS